MAKLLRIGAAVLIAMFGIAALGLGALAASHDGESDDPYPTSSTSTTTPTGPPVTPSGGGSGGGGNGGGNGTGPATGSSGTDTCTPGDINCHGSLPFTGGDILALAGIGLGLISFGAATYVVGRGRNSDRQ